MKRALVFATLFLVLAVAPSPSSPADGTKEELIRLQSDVLALTNQIRVLEKGFNEQTQGLKSLVVQLNDQVGQSFLLIQRLSTELEARVSSDRQGIQSMIEEIRSVSRKMDDNATRTSALAQQISDMKVESKPITQRIYQSAASTPGSQSLSADGIYYEAYNDLIQGNFDLAVEGFRAFLKNFPSNEKADDAQYNIGEAFYSSKKFPEAITAFTAVINDHPDGDKAASAYFKRGKAELLIGERENATNDFKTVVQKYGDTPEASLAAGELTQLGVDPTKLGRPAPARRRPL
ncbi:MAG: tetratricopeptide repeat protein [Acidobacteriota bacterium]